MNKMEELEEWLEEIKESWKLVVVEGKKDRNALLFLGLKNVYAIDKKPIFKAVEEIAAMSNRVVILTDLDSEGKKIFGKLNSDLQYHGVEVDNYYREFLFRNTKLRQIEGMPSYIENLKTKNQKTR